MGRFKTADVELIGLRYDKEKRKYRALFQILNMETENYDKISKNKQFLSKRNFEIAACNVGNKTIRLIADWLSEEEFEGYESLIEIAKDKGDEIPERIHPQILEQELDMHTLEENMSYYLSACEEELKKIRVR